MYFSSSVGDNKSIENKKISKRIFHKFGNKNSTSLQYLLNIFLLRYEQLSFLTIHAISKEDLKNFDQGGEICRMFKWNGDLLNVTWIMQCEHI